jgi:hypothetical protein
MPLSASVGLAAGTASMREQLRDTLKWPKKPRRQLCALGVGLISGGASLSRGSSRGAVDSG